MTTSTVRLLPAAGTLLPALVLVPVLALGLGGLPPAQAAAITNPDFSDSPDFTGWSGEVVPAPEPPVPVPADPATNPAFALPGGGLAELRTLPNPQDPDNGIIEVLLFQDFVLPAALGIAFDYDWRITSLDDFVAALLVWGATTLDLFSEAGVDTLALTGSGRAVIDFSRLAPNLNPSGQPVSLIFLVSDGGDDEQDRLRAGNIELAVPLPATWLLLLAGLGAVAARRRV